MSSFWITFHGAVHNIIFTDANINAQQSYSPFNMPRPASHQQDQVVEVTPDAFSDDKLWIVAVLRVIENVSFKKIAHTLEKSNLFVMSRYSPHDPKAGRFTAESVISKYMEMMFASRTNKNNSNQEEPLSDHIKQEAVSEAKGN